MVEIEKYPCSDGNEATSRERYHYEILHASLNMIRPILSVDERKENRKTVNIVKKDIKKKTITKKK